MFFLYSYPINFNISVFEFYDCIILRQLNDGIMTVI